jgi:hypothetical protein
MNRRKILRMKFTIDFFKDLAGRGWEKTIVEDNGLPEDAQMIHMSFDPETNSVDMFFISEEGQSIQEGESLYSLEASCPMFKIIPTIDRKPVKQLIDEFEKDVYPEDEKPISKERCVKLIEKLRELGI